MTEYYDALLLLSFGGPEKREDVIPFLETVLRGRDVPRRRMLAVADHYYALGGASPINELNRELTAALEKELIGHGIRLPIYFGNRNWHPWLPDTLRQMRDEGVRRALVFVTSIFSSYSGCRQYLEDMDRARAEIGSDAPQLDKLRSFYNHPDFIEAIASRITDSLGPRSPAPGPSLVFTAHSIPVAMARGCDYEKQLREACRLVAERIGATEWSLAYQSRSGPPAQPWLEPDVNDHLRTLHQRGVHHVAIVPIGFISDHVEVLYDLDHQARQTCDQLGMKMARVPTVHTHPRFMAAIRRLIEERLRDDVPRLAIGQFGPCPDVCPPTCCPVAI